MKISTRGRYGLRILLDLALHQSDSPRMIRDIAESQQISEKYISRLIIALRQAGLVSSVRGAKGGYRLACPPADISILNVVEIMEGKISVVECVRAPDGCSRADGCPARSMWSGINRKIEDALSGVTLQDIVDDYRSGAVSCI